MVDDVFANVTTCFPVTRYAEGVLRKIGFFLATLVLLLMEIYTLEEGEISVAGLSMALTSEFEMNPEVIKIVSASDIIRTSSGKPIKAKIMETLMPQGEPV